MNNAIYGKILFQNAIISINNNETISLNDNFTKKYKNEIHRIILSYLFKKSFSPTSYTSSELFNYVLKHYANNSKDKVFIKFLISSIVKQYMSSQKYINIDNYTFDYDYSESCSSESEYQSIIDDYKDYYLDSDISTFSDNETVYVYKNTGKKLFKNCYL